MKILNTPETAVSIQTGIYKIINVHRFPNTAQSPVALVQLKKNVLQKAPKDIAFFVELKNLNSQYATGDVHIKILDIKNLIYVKEVDLIPQMINGELQMIEAVEWYALNKFMMYDLYKQQGDGALVSPSEEYDGIAEAIVQQEIDFTILENHALEDMEDSYDEDIEDNYDEDYTDDPEQPL